MKLFLQIFSQPGMRTNCCHITKMRCVVLWAYLLWAMPLWAQDPVVFSLPTSLTGAAGDTVTVDVELDPGEQQVAFLGAALKTDGAVLQFVDYRVGPIAAAGNFSLKTVKSDSVRMVYFDTGAGPISQSGILVSVRFEVLASAAEGDSAQLTLSDVSAGDPLANALPINIENGLFAIPYSPVQFSGAVFNDLNADGVWDAGESGLPNWEIHLIALSPSDTLKSMTAADGRFEFAEVAHGAYRIEQNLTAGWEPSLPLQPGYYERTLAPGEAADALYFGNWQPASVRGTTWHDLNADGIHDQEEPPLPAWTMRLLANGDSAAVTSDENGAFAFERLLPGNYRLEQVAMPDWQVSVPQDSAYNLSIEPGQALMNLDFGNWQWAEFGGLLWEDQDSSGSKTDDEAGFAGWPVWIAGHLAGGAVLADTVLTDSSGHYRFAQLTPGSYTLSIAVQGNYRLVSQPGNPYTFEVISGMNEANIDFGFVQRVSTAIGDAGEDGLPQTFALQQNYPNPFNPGTTIPFSVAKSGHVRLEILDLLGKRVAVLIDEFKSAGNYEADVRALNWSSGIYFYKLTAGPEIVLLKRMIFSK